WPVTYILARAEIALIPWRAGLRRNSPLERWAYRIRQGVIWDCPRRARSPRRHAPQRCGGPSRPSTMEPTHDPGSQPLRPDRQSQTPSGDADARIRLRSGAVGRLRQASRLPDLDLRVPIRRGWARLLRLRIRTQAGARRPRGRARLLALQSS